MACSIPLCLTLSSQNVLLDTKGLFHRLRVSQLSLGLCLSKHSCPKGGQGLNLRISAALLLTKKQTWS
jgi:hypothetical protein